MESKGSLLTDLTLPYLERFEARSVNPVLLIFLHGKGADEKNLFQAASFFPSDYIILSPRAPKHFSAGGYYWFETTRPSAQVLEIDHASALEARKGIAEFVKCAQYKCEVQTTRTFVLGFSQGAILALGLAFLAPALIAGAIAMSAKLFMDYLSKNSVPILLTHGVHDEVIGIQDAYQAKHELNRFLVDFTFKQYALGHELTAECFLDAAAWIVSKIH